PGSVSASEKNMNFMTVFLSSRAGGSDALARAEPVEDEIQDLVGDGGLAVFADRPVAQWPDRTKKIDEIGGKLDVANPEMAVAHGFREKLVEDGDVLRIELVDLPPSLGRQRAGLLEHQLDEPVILVEDVHHGADRADEPLPGRDVARLPLLQIHDDVGHEELVDVVE